jgi:hypothetical protein
MQASGLNVETGYRGRHDDLYLAPGMGSGYIDSEGPRGVGSGAVQAEGYL